MVDTNGSVISFEDLRHFSKQAYETVGVPANEAEIISDLLVRADLRGIKTHGVTRLPIYIQRIENDYVRKKCEFNIHRKKGATAFITANGSMGHIVAQKAMAFAVSLAEVHGISWVSVKDSSHFGTAGIFSMMAAEKDMIGYVCSSSGPLMAPFGGRDKLLGNNPMSYAFPADKALPVVVDFSCSVVAAGRIMLMRRNGEKIPLGWAVDKEGLPTDDPYEATQGGGSLAPVGAHKGYGLTLSHELLTALLTGGKLSRNIIGLFGKDESGIQGTCHSFMVIDPDCFVGRKAYKTSMDEYIKTIKGSNRAKGTDEIFMPGEIEARTEAEYLKHGIPLVKPTAESLMDLAKHLGISNPLV